MVYNQEYIKERGQLGMEKAANLSFCAASFSGQEKSYHVIVTEDIHRGLKMYASKHKLSITDATVRLLRAGLMSELQTEVLANNPRIERINLRIHKLAEKRVKRIRGQNTKTSIKPKAIKHV
jgi:hypothetical protein